MGSDESHVNVSLTVSDKVTRLPTNTSYNLFEKKGEPKRNRTDTLLLTSLMPYDQAKLAPLKYFPKSKYVPLSPLHVLFGGGGAGGGVTLATFFHCTPLLRSNNLE